jgi:hypothetical protein
MKTASQSVKITEVIAKLAGKIVSTFLKHTNVWGAAIIMILIIISLVFVYMTTRSSHSVITKIEKEL